jgi:hypothetical protein
MLATRHLVQSWLAVSFNLRAQAKKTGNSDPKLLLLATHQECLQTAWPFNGLVAGGDEAPEQIFDYGSSILFAGRRVSRNGSDSMSARPCSLPELARPRHDWDGDLTDLSTEPERPSAMPFQRDDPASTRFGFRATECRAQRNPKEADQCRREANPRNLGLG